MEEYIMHENMIKALGILTLVLFVLSMTGAAACSGSTCTTTSYKPVAKADILKNTSKATINYKKIQANSTNSKVSLKENTVVEVAQLKQINTALKNGPVLLKIGAEWCGSCQKMKPILNKLATEYGGKATIMAVDVDQSPKLADYFGVSSIPDFSVIVGTENGKYVYMQQNGKVTRSRSQTKIVGLNDKRVFENVLDFTIKK
jgi:thioredoxin 1